MRTRNRSGQKQLGRALTTAAAAGLALFTSSCSFIVETRTSQCTTNADCKGVGEDFICRKDTQLCVSLLSKECTSIHGDSDGVIADNAIIIGSILPTSGGDASSGLPLKDAINIAINDIRSKASGVPGPDGNPRQLVVVHCDDQGDEQLALIPAKHLAEDVKVPAIIGSAFSGPTIAMANTVTIDAGVLLFSPSATSAELTNLSKDQSKGLVWRTAPSDTFQTQALAKYVPPLVVDPATAKIAVLTEADDPYGEGLTQSLEAILTIDGKLIAQQTSQYSRYAFSPSDMPGSQEFNATVDQVTSGPAPQIILILTADPLGIEYMGAIDKRFASSGAALPRYIFADGGRIPELWGYKDMTDELRKRITGTSPGQADTDPVYSAFLLEFKADAASSNDDPTTFGAAGAYDITFLLAYTSAAVLAQKKPLSGQSLASQMKNVSDPSGQAVKAGQNINDGFNYAASGNINFVGASGPLDFDANTGEAPSNIQIWCLPSDGNGKARSAVNSTVYYDVTTSNLVGTVDMAACNY